MTFELEVLTCELCNFELKGSFEKHEKSYRHQRKLLKATKRLGRFIQKDRRRIQKNKRIWGKFKGIKKLRHFNNVRNFDLCAANLD